MTAFFAYNIPLALEAYMGAMRKLVVAGMILVLGTLAASAQEAVSSPKDSGAYAKNCVYFEALGQGMFYSFNYEYMFTPHLSGRVGYTNWSIPIFFLVSAGVVNYQGGPVMLNYLWGDGDHHLETGIGAVLGAARYDGVGTIFGENISVKYKFFPLGTATVGYRYQPREGGFLFKLGVTPIFNETRFMPTGGMSFGYAF